MDTRTKQKVKHIGIYYRTPPICDGKRHVCSGAALAYTRARLGADAHLCGRSFRCGTEAAFICVVRGVISFPSVGAAETR